MSKVNVIEMETVHNACTEIGSELYRELWEHFNHRNHNTAEDILENIHNEVAYLLNKHLESNLDTGWELPHE